MCQKQPTHTPPRKNTTHMLEIPTPGKKKIDTKSSYCQKIIIFFFLIQTSLNTMQLFLHCYPLLDMNNLANGSPIWPIFFSKMMSSFFFKMVPKNDKIFFSFPFHLQFIKLKAMMQNCSRLISHTLYLIKFQKKFHHFNIIIILIHLISNHLNSSYNSDRGVLD